MSNSHRANRPIYFTGTSPSGEVVVGTTRPGLFTESGQPIWLESDDAGEFLEQANQADWTGYKNLPAEGEPVSKGIAYSYGDELVLCRQSHARTTVAPQDDLEHFVTYRNADGDTIPPWIVGEEVYAGYILSYNEITYEVLQSHKTQADWTPPTVPALFVVISDGGEIPDWVQPTGAHDAYNTGDEVRFEGTHYRSLIDANVWSPTVYAAGWEEVL